MDSQSRGLQLGSELGLTIRGRKVLMQLGTGTLDELCQKTAVDVVTCRNTGQSTLKEIREKLKRVGRHLRDDPPPQEEEKHPLVAALQKLCSMTAPAMADILEHHGYPYESSVILELIAAYKANPTFAAK